jgi:hypothetical protein
MLQHFIDVFKEAKADAALAASIFHFGEIPIPELKKAFRCGMVLVLGRRRVLSLPSLFLIFSEIIYATSKTL